MEISGYVLLVVVVRDSKVTLMHDRHEQTQPNKLKGWCSAFTTSLTYTEITKATVTIWRSLCRVVIVCHTCLSRVVVSWIRSKWNTKVMYIETVKLHYLIVSIKWYYFTYVSIKCAPDLQFVYRVTSSQKLAYYRGFSYFFYYSYLA